MAPYKYIFFYCALRYDTSVLGQAETIRAFGFSEVLFFLGEGMGTDEFKEFKWDFLAEGLF